MKTKICNKCKIEKDLNEFSKCESNKDKLQRECKQCNKKYRKDNKEKIKKYFEKNYEKKLEYKHIYRNSKTNYNTFAKQISWTKDPVRNVDNFLQVKCTYCGKWYFPIISSIEGRIRALKNNGSSKNQENRLYCSEECKQACPIFHKIKYQEGHPKQNENNQVREVQPELRQMVFERDNYTCLKCKRKDIVLHCHHIEGIRWNPLESADIDQCMTVCKNCHAEIHQQEDCGYNDLQCKKAA